MALDMSSVTSAISATPSSSRPGIAVGVFRAVQLALLPLATVGYVHWVARLVRHSRQSGASATVLASQYARWMQHQLGTRRDAPCSRLMKVLPNVPAFGLALVSAPTLLGHRLSRYVPRIYRYPYEGDAVMAHHAAARTSFYDAVVERRSVVIEQLVVLGAGLDTRAQRLPARAALRCFEVDTPKTQAFKLEMSRRAGIEAPAVTYVSADFSNEDWLERLVAAGFDPNKPTLFTWESVCMYLDGEAVERTLRSIASSAPGSIVAFDYLAKELVEDRSAFGRCVQAILRALGEPWTFGIATSSPGEPAPAAAPLLAFLARCGLSLVEQRLVWKDPLKRQVAAGFVVAAVDASTFEPSCSTRASGDNALGDSALGDNGLASDS
jgi:methyltransferase (TIGR00027 family)